MRASPPSQDDRDVALAYSAVELPVLRWSSSPVPGRTSPIVVAVVKNEIDFVSDFLTHYRTLGVERFAFVDNASSDGTREYLLTQPDVDVFLMTEAFGWRRKQAWINRVIDYYGSGRWYLCVDADERLAYDGYEGHSVQELISVLEQRGLTRGRGFLLEMYSDLPLVLGCAGDVSLRSSYPYYDARGYVEERLPHIISRRGGVRMRAFAGNDPEFKPQLTKYPLFRLDEGEIFSNPHHIWPYEANFHSPCYLALLHYKFHGDWANRVSRAVSEKTYWNDSREYRAYAEAIARQPDLSLWTEDSSCLEQSSDLVRVGLIEGINWPEGPDEFATTTRLHRARRMEQGVHGSGLTALDLGAR